MTKGIKKLGVILFVFVSCVLAGFFTMSSSNIGYADSVMAINHFNLSFRDNVCIKYAVETDKANTKVLVWTEVSDSYEKGTEKEVLETVGVQIIDGKEHQIFDYTKLYAKNMTDEVYARAYANVDGAEYYSPVAKYSILQYAYNKLGKTDTASENEKLKVALTKMLEYGAAMQEYTGYNLDKLATDNFVQVKLSSGVLSDGFTDGLYKAGSTVTLAAPETNNEGDVFIRWVDKAGNTVSETATYTLTVGAENNTYTPVYEEYSQGLTFASNGDGTCSVTGIGTCTDTDIVIPSVSPNGDSVTLIGSFAFSSCSSLTSVTMGSRVTMIRDGAFFGCTNLTEITIPDSVTWVGADVFELCSSLTSITVDENNTDYQSIDGNLYTKDGTTLIQYAIGKTATEFTIPDSVTLIGYKAFSMCSSLTSVTIGSSVTTIGDWAFSRCSSLTEITIPDSVTLIWNKAFSMCSSLTSVTIGSSVTTIGDWAFYACDSLTNITVDETNPNYKSIDGNLYTKDGTTLIQYAIGKTATEFTIPDGVTSIRERAFEDCDSLKEIVIPDSVTLIGYNAFSRCSSLTSVTIGSGVTSIGDYAFYDCSNLTSVTFENTSGWKVDSTEISSTDLADTAKAAEYLTSRYCYYIWTRTDE